MVLPRYDVVLTTDRSMMSNYHGKEFLGFVTTGPLFITVGPFRKIGEWIHEYIAMPKMKVDKYGRPHQAPYGMRKIEAALLDAGISAAIIDPDHVHKYIPSARILMLSHHDYFGFNPPSSTWSAIVGRESLNAYSFRRFMTRIRPYVMDAKRNNGLKVVVGGPSAWQWLYLPELMGFFGIDSVFDGEGEKLAVEVVRRILNNEPVPRYVYVGVNDVPSIDEIPSIKYPAINGFVEIGRGCPRGCAFCSVTLRPLRWYPLEKIEEELKLHVKHGIVHGLIHSDDVPLYGSTGIELNPDKLIALHKLVKRYYLTIAWSHTTLASVLIAEKKYDKLATKIAEIIEDEHQDWWGAQVGLETGSRRLAKAIMPGKAAPFKIEDWWDVVEEALGVMHDIKLIPALTVIVGLPGETEDDVMETIELLDRIRPYRSLVVPMFYVPMNHIRAEKDGWIIKYNLMPEHIELMKKMFEHSIYWAKDIVNHFYLRGPQYWPVRAAVNYFINYVEGRVRSMYERLDQIAAEIKDRKLVSKVEAPKLLEMYGSSINDEEQQ
ncbi:B12-binding domain-containing radical SAM protein [Vulcanisaeta souniana]|uniref:Radical SAM protein n=2 Tax=Vulcanisaeta souniana JCM 11219 TaxID=1293586 RepID=A0ABM8BMP4_9CREN|nr:radical SAM protein [Vulcanisaeta souniana]BDR92155.1 radical SAM protein [Vulcanisaeta souniana JCM 11219]